MSDSDRGYYFIDGSTLLSHITWIWKKYPEYSELPLDINVFVERLQNAWARYSGVTVRINMYFRKNDKRLKTHLITPKSNVPRQKSHWEIIECGEKNIIPPRALSKIVEQFPEFADNLIPQEKRVDMRLACDALLLLANSRATCEVLYVNDSDYIPLVEAIKNLGGNAYLTCLTHKYPIQKQLCDISDMFISLDDDLNTIFRQREI